MQVSPDVNAARVDQDHGLAVRMAEIETALDGNPWLFVPWDQLVVGIRHDLGKQIGAVDEALARLAVRIHHQDVRFGR
jgi:hypothetical protein